MTTPRRWKTPGRAQRALAALVVLVVSVASTALVARWLLLRQLDDDVDSELVAEVSEFQQLAREVDAGDRGSESEVSDAFDRFFAANVPGTDGVFLALVGDRPYLRSADAPYPIEDLDELVGAWSRSSTSAYGTAQTPAGSMRYLVSPVTDPEGVTIGSLVVGRFPGAARADLTAAVWTMSVVAILVSALTATVAWLVLGRRLRASASATRTAGPAADRAALPTAPSGPAVRRSFFADADRELRAPITVVRSHLDDADPERPLSAASRQVVFGELDRMARIVDDLALLAEAARDDFLRIRPVDVAHLTTAIADRARPLAERTWEVRPGALAVALADGDRLGHAWMHLVRNAVEHTWRGDRITIFSDVAGGDLELGVVDAGRGIAPDELAQLFEPFRRGADTPRRATAGGGLGLPVARAVAEAHGGRVEVRDTPGGGATVVLVVPLVLAIDDPDGPLGEEPRWRGDGVTAPAGP